MCKTNTQTPILLSIHIVLYFDLNLRDKPIATKLSIMEEGLEV